MAEESRVLRRSGEDSRGAVDVVGAWGLGLLDLVVAAAAAAAASRLSWRMVLARGWVGEVGGGALEGVDGAGVGVGVGAAEGAGGLEEVNVDIAGAGLEGVLELEGTVEVEGAGVGLVVGLPTCSTSSPYSFHSSTSTMSCVC